jgi:hypothetical protein
MCGPPDPEAKNRPVGRGTANRRIVLKKPNQTTEPAVARQFQSPLKLQAFCLARRFALSAPLAEAIAVLVYGVWRS